MARPRKVFSPHDVEQIKVLARCHCPDTEIAAFMGCSEPTIQRHFRDLLREQREAGKANIRATQFRLAIGNEAKGIKPNVTLLIWLGKQLLGQRDQSLHEITQPKGENRDQMVKEIWAQLVSLAEEKKSLGLIPA